MREYHIRKLTVNNHKYVAMVSEVNVLEVSTWLYTQADMVALMTRGSEPFKVILKDGTTRSWFDAITQPLQTASKPQVANIKDDVDYWLTGNLKPEHQAQLNDLVARKQAYDKAS